MKTILFILQNGYHSDKYQYRNEEEWYCDLNRSFSGKRLSEMIPENADIKVINSSSNIGDNADSYYKADLDHLRKCLTKYNADIICACGEVAQEGCKKLGIDYVSLPHPAWRALSKDITKNIKQNLYELAST